MNAFTFGDGQHNTGMLNLIPRSSLASRQLLQNRHISRRNREVLGLSTTHEDQLYR
ncbi:MAG: hypothetical protein ACXW36_10615 [Nitrospira sp.]